MLVTGFRTTFRRRKNRRKLDGNVLLYFLESEEKPNDQKRKKRYPAPPPLVKTIIPAYRLQSVEKSHLGARLAAPKNCRTGGERETQT